MVKSAAEIITNEQLDDLRKNGFIVIHAEPNSAMEQAFYANEWPESVSFQRGFNRMVGTSIKIQNGKITKGLNKLKVENDG